MNGWVDDAEGPASPIRDPGLQAERTALAWNRTALAVLVNALLVLRSGWSSRTASLTVLGIALMAAAGAAIAYGAWRRRHLTSDHPSIAPRAAAVAIAAGVALATCAAGLASIIVSS